MRSIDRITGQGWNGVEAAAVLRGVAKPAWRQGVAWHDAERGVMWRADETDLVTEASPPAARTVLVDKQQEGNQNHDTLEPLVMAKRTNFL
jgi:hypothetical protein